MTASEIKSEIKKRTDIQKGTIDIVMDSLINEIENALLTGDFIWILKFGRMWLRIRDRQLYNTVKKRHQTLRKYAVFIKTSKDIKMGVRGFI